MPKSNTPTNGPSILSTQRAGPDLLRQDHASRRRSGRFLELPWFLRGHKSRGSRSMQSPFCMHPWDSNQGMKRISVHVCKGLTDAASVGSFPSTNEKGLNARRKS